MIRVFGIAVEPVLCTFERAPCKRLLHKGAGHKCHLVKKNAAQGHTLYQCRRAFIAPAEQIETVFHVALSDFKVIAADFFLHCKTERFEDWQQRRNNIAPQRCNSFAAHCKRGVVVAVQRPADKGNGHTKCFAGAHRAVADNTAFVLVSTALAPPVKRGELLF